MHNLLDYVCVQNVGQVLITDTHAERIREHLENLGVGYQVICL
jgi:DNA replication and repair protein RecF